MHEDMTLQILRYPDGCWKCIKTTGAGEQTVHDAEVEYRVYDANGEFYAAATTEEEARRYIEQPGDYMTTALTIEGVL
jgi:hypothetical protein